MSLKIDGIEIENRLIVQEIERLRPDYREVFKDQPVEEQEERLLEWARENVTERFLFLRYAQKETTPIPEEKIEQACYQFMDQHPDILIDDDQLEKEMEHQLLVEQAAQKITADILNPDDPDAEDRRNQAIEAFVDRLKKKSVISFEMDDQLSELLKDSFASENQFSSTDTAEEEEKKDERSRYPKPLDSILIKPAGPDCNMACTYCFYLEKSRLFADTPVHRMSDEVLEKMIRQAMDQSGTHISFGWQGGEPTLMGLEFFRKAVELQKRFGQGKVVGNGLQTNGLLIDQDWIGFLKENSFLVGLSLDGPRHIHDHYRQNSRGSGSWETVTENAKKMLKGGVAVNALSVLNDYSAQFPEEIYNFHKEMGLIYMQFIPCVEEDPKKPGEIAPYSVSPEQYGKSLCTLFDLWYEDFTEEGPTTFIRFFDSIFYRYVGLEPPDCTLRESCGVYVVVEHNGDVYSCDFFVDPQHRLGNVMEENLIEMLNSPGQTTFGCQKALLPETCKKCNWLPVCLGGCPADRIGGGKYVDVPSHLCDAYKMFFKYADPRLQKLAEEWKTKRSE